MRDNELIQKTEDYVKQAFEAMEGSLSIAHDFKHVDRVRKWALVIADAEKYPSVEMVEVTALLHDIGLNYLNDGDERKMHGPVGAEVAEEFLHSSSNLNTEDIKLIVDAIRYHGLSPSVVHDHFGDLGNKGELLKIIRDADNLDALGATGIVRAFTSHYYLPEYDPTNIKGIAWGLSSSEFREKFRYDIKKGLAPVNTIIDQVNQQIRYYDYMHTKTARDIATPLTQFMKDFVLQLEHEITFPNQ